MFGGRDRFMRTNTGSYALWLLKNLVSFVREHLGASLLDIHEKNVYGLEVEPSVFSPKNCCTVQDLSKHFFPLKS